jgi:hypothetical protein
MMRLRSKQAKAKAKSLRDASVLVRSTHPPSINPQITYSQRLRFISNATGTQAVTFQNLLDCIFVATTPIVGYDLFDAVKVKAVELWCQGITNAPTTVNVDFSGASAGTAGSGQIVSDTSMGIEPAHVLARPSKASACGQWQGSNTLIAFTLLVPNETVVDVVVSFRNTAVAPVLYQNAGAGMTPGQIYYRGIDGQSIAATKFVPQALETA